MKLKPLKNNLILRPIESSYKGQIAIPDMYKHIGSRCEVIGIGEKVHPMITEGAYVMCENGFTERKKTLNEHKDFLCNESNLIGVIFAGKVVPIGDNLLFERDMSEITFGGNLIAKASNRNYQSLYGWVRASGIPHPERKHKTIEGIKINSYYRLAEWESHMKSFSYNNRYYLLVKPQDLLATWTQELRQ